MIDPDVLDRLEALVKRSRIDPEGFSVASGDAIHRLAPDARMKLNSDASWVVGPKSRSRLHAEQDRELIAAAVEYLPKLLAEIRSLKGE